MRRVASRGLSFGGEKKVKRKGHKEFPALRSETQQIVARPLLRRGMKKVDPLETLMSKFDITGQTLSPPPLPAGLGSPPPQAPTSEPASSSSTSRRKSSLTPRCRTWFLTPAARTTSTSALCRPAAQQAEPTPAAQARAQRERGARDHPRLPDAESASLRGALTRISAPSSTSSCNSSAPSVAAGHHADG